MVKPGYYIFLFLDICGYTTMRIHTNDTCLIPDSIKLYEYEAIDFKYFYCKDDFSLLCKCLRIIEEHGVSVVDMSGSFLEPGFHLCDEARLLIIDMLAAYFDQLPYDLKQIILSEKPEYGLKGVR